MARLSLCDARASLGLPHPFLFPNDFQPSGSIEKESFFRRLCPTASQCGITRASERIVAIQTPTVDQSLVTIALNKIDSMACVNDRHDRALRTFDDPARIICTSGSQSPALEAV